MGVELETPPKEKVKKSIGAFEPSASLMSWIGDNKVYSGAEIRTVRTGEPVVLEVYHGTTNDFYEFDASIKGNIEGHLGKVNYFTSEEYDAEQNYSTSEGADLSNRMELEAERLEGEYALEDLEKFNTEQELIEKYNITYSNIEGLSRAQRAELIARRKFLGTEEKVLDLYVKLNNPVVIGNGYSFAEMIPESSYEDSLDEAAK